MKFLIKVYEVKSSSHLQPELAISLSMLSASHGLILAGAPVQSHLRVTAAAHWILAGH